MCFFLSIHARNLGSKFWLRNFSLEFQLRISAWNFSLEFQAEFFELKFSAWKFSSKKQAEIFSLFFASWNSESKFQLLAENFDSEWYFDLQMYQPLITKPQNHFTFLTVWKCPTGLQYSPKSSWYVLSSKKPQANSAYEFSSFHKDIIWRIMCVLLWI